MSASRRCGDDAPSAASGYNRGSARDEIPAPPRRLHRLPMIFAKPGLNPEIALNQILPGLAFVIHLMTDAQSFIDADPIVISELATMIGDDFFPKSPTQQSLKVNVQKHTGFLIRRQRAGEDSSGKALQQ